MAELEFRAKAKYVHISPRKIHKIVGAVKGQPVETGLNKLKFMPQKSAALVEKIVRSALANAEQSANVDIDDLIIQNVIADQGPTMKRFRARARGRGTRILKRTSHITVTLAEKSL